MLVTALIFFLILTILVFVHELGHFLVAKWAGIFVEEFGFGLPPRIIGKKIGETVYSINWLPIGGFVKLYGEDGEEKRTSMEKRSFAHKSKKIRGAVLIAGVVMNFFVAVGITSYLLTQGVLEPSGRVHIERILPGSPAEKAGLKEKDIIENVQCPMPKAQCEDKKIKMPKDLIEFVKARAGEQVSLTIVREGKELVVSLIPRKDYPPGEGPMGVAISDLELKTYSWREAPGMAVRINVRRGKDMLSSIGRMIWRIASLQPVGGEVAGPIGIAQVTGEAVKFGWKAVLEFMSILSLNLAVLNVLPIPALDGGRLAFVFLEKILGKKVAPAFERSAHQIGMIILLFLILLISLNDILRLARGG